MNSVRMVWYIYFEEATSFVLWTAIWEMKAGICGSVFGVVCGIRLA